MNANRSSLAVALALLVGACAPATWYTDAEAPKNLRLDSATTQLDMHFASGSAYLTWADAARLRHLVASGGVGPADRVTVAAAGSPYLAEQRAGSVAALLLHYGIVVDADRSASVPPDRAILSVHRTLVTLPACPNFSKPSAYDFANQPSSNFGCATQTNLGMMVAKPSDLAGGVSGGGSPGQPAAAAVNRYLNDKVQLPTASSGLPIASATSTPTPSTPSTGGSQ